ncbi:prepilin-type N-terminal cleavage/methylation domain-containing protein [Opitutaceae bacterium TAV4]|nr:prepilin-type N-terminal cleavage/methylation domain-containing protein [Opitutaceae bacterium TAV4]RRK02654.1 prepilin-type N-terminal cleavage/methylation domain-containing protein [Opitutaceae bacterium TAV3]
MKTSPNASNYVHRTSAFTLIELLTVIAIIGILAAITLAAVSRVRAQAQQARCGSNIRQLATLAAIWAQDNGDWVPQACWAWKGIHNKVAGATNLRNVGYNDKVGTCGAVNDGLTYPPHYGLNSQLASAANNTVYYVHGYYKFSSVLTSRTILFAETKWVSNWSQNASNVTDAAPEGGGRTGAYLAAVGDTTTFDTRHNGKGYVAYTDGHIALKTVKDLTAPNSNNDPWKAGIPQ